jgi:hypothetical protein
VRRLTNKTLIRVTPNLQNYNSDNIKLLSCSKSEYLSKRGPNPKREHSMYSSKIT